MISPYFAIAATLDFLHFCLCKKTSIGKKREEGSKAISYNPELEMNESPTVSSIEGNGESIPNKIRHN